MLPLISVQLYSVREQAAKDYEGTIRAIADMGFPCVEPAGYPGTTPAAAAKLFAALGLKAVSCHGALPVGDDKNRVIEEALMLGHKYVITGCPPDFKAHYETVDRIKAMVDLYNEGAENAAPHGLQIGYHNHDWDLAEVDGKPGYRYILEGTPETVLWEADLFWVARAGLNPAEFVKEIGPRGICLHFKDGIVTAEGEFTEAETEDGKIMVSDAKPFLPAGSGQVDLVAAAQAAAYTRYAVVELDSYEGDMMKAVQESYTYLTTHGIARGRN
jgi:sugar phosphate isomerase/epimerase